MANEQKKQTTDPSNRPNKPGQRPSGGSSGSQPGQQTPGGRRSDEWSDKGGPNRPAIPAARAGWATTAIWIRMRAKTRRNAGV